LVAEEQEIPTAAHLEQLVMAEGYRILMEQQTQAVVAEEVTFFRVDSVVLVWL
jgi:hypothetical protein